MTMSSFNSSKLSTTLVPPATSSYPVSGRKYTLTHSDTTGQLFLSIGCSYNNKAIDKNMRDEVLAALHVTDRQAVIQGEVFVSGGEFSREQAQLRYQIFRRELPLALEAMFYGDQAFFQHYPDLLNTPIYIYFISTYQEFRGWSYYQTPKFYLKQTCSS